MISSNVVFAQRHFSSQDEDPFIVGTLAIELQLPQNYTLFTWRQIIISSCLCISCTRRRFFGTSKVWFFSIIHRTGTSGGHQELHDAADSWLTVKPSRSVALRDASDPRTIWGRPQKKLLVYFTRPLITRPHLPAIISDDRRRHKARVLTVGCGGGHLY